MNIQQDDNMLWKLAKRRASFKYSLTIYLVINILLMALWLFHTPGEGYFWPAWSIFGWGISIVWQYLHAYHDYSMYSATGEYEKLKKQNQS